MKNDNEIQATLTPLLLLCDAAELQYIAGMAVAAALEKLPPEDRHRALDDAIQQFRTLLPGMRQD